MDLLLYNTLTKRKEKFIPIHSDKVSMYNCGPTVYSSPHIGNFRAFVFGDILRRYLEYHKYKVVQIMNITDVGHMTEDDEDAEDKMELTAKKEKKDPWEIAQYYEQEFMNCVELLNLRKAYKYPRATEHINEMIEMVSSLLSKGYAYAVNGSVYFDISKFPKYGKLSGNSLEALTAGKRIAINPEKKNPYDFALWKVDPKHIMQWDSPWSKGFPGWHIECSAMSMKYLGETIDIHTGGEDNIFPHHECEIAQSECSTGKPFVKYWLHVRHLLVNNEKMSKSKGNFYTVNDIFNLGISPMALKYALSSTHYRQQYNFTIEGLNGAQSALTRIYNASVTLTENQNKPASNFTTITELVSQYKTDFEKAMNDDLNTSSALSSLFNFIKEVNKVDPTGSAAKTALDFTKQIMNVFGIKIPLPITKLPLNDEIDNLIQERETARENKNFDRADKIRDMLKQQGIILVDTPDGVKWKKE